MRIGHNPLKEVKIEQDFYHRIIVPVFVPNLEEEYFKNGLEVTRYCLESLHKTRHPKSFVTVVNNGSCAEVTQYLQGQFEHGAIDQLIHYKENKGKIDAIIPIAKTAQEPLITLSDGDVLFKQGWMQAVEEVFFHFPEAGMVSPVPHGTMYNHYTTNTLFDGFLKGILKFQSLCDANDMLRFAESIGKKETMYQKNVRLQHQLTVNRGDSSAVVGCGHFVATLRKEVFQHAPQGNSHWAYASTADRDYIDLPNEKAKLWRLATVENLAFHMGNNPTLWMEEEFRSLGSNEGAIVQIPKSRHSWVPLGFKKIIVRVLLSGFLRPRFWKWVGLKEGRDVY
ncbi:MAG: glycosyltransferase family A protein [Flavobacteriaceae bacterium]